MNLGEPIFLFILAFILLGPKRASDLTRQLGKLMAEFRKASNDFKFQFNEEMRVSEQQEQQKKQEAERAALGAGEQAALPAPGQVTEPENRILPPGEAEVAAGEAADEAASEAVPYAVSAVSATTGEEQPVEDHPLLRVDVIPPMEDKAGGEPAAPIANAAPVPQAAPGPDAAPAAENLPTNGTGGEHAERAREEDGATIHHG